VTASADPAPADHGVTDRAENNSSNAPATAGADHPAGVGAAFLVMAIVGPNGPRPSTRRRATTWPLARLPPVWPSARTCRRAGWSRPPARAGTAPLAGCPARTHWLAVVLMARARRDHPGQLGEELPASSPWTPQRGHETLR
jgi:hypothetical protein